MVNACVPLLVMAGAVAPFDDINVPPEPGSASLAHCASLVNTVHYITARLQEEDRRPRAGLSEWALLTGRWAVSAAALLRQSLVNSGRHL